MLDRTNAERQRRYRARHKAPTLTPRQRFLIINAVQDKSVTLDALSVRFKNPNAAELASEYRIITDILQAIWATK